MAASLWSLHQHHFHAVADGRTPACPCYTDTCQGLEQAGGKLAAPVYICLAGTQLPACQVPSALISSSLPTTPLRCYLDTAKNAGRAESVPTPIV